MAASVRSAYQSCLLDAFVAALARQGITFHARRIGRLVDPDPAVAAAVAAIWEITFRRDGRRCYVAWVAMEPGVTPDVLDFIVPTDLEPPGPAPQLPSDAPGAPTAEPEGEEGEPGLEPGWEAPGRHHWAVLGFWGRWVQRYDALQALLDALTPDAPSRARLSHELLAATGRCALAVPAPGW
jgi:hypothetical protein